MPKRPNQSNNTKTACKKQKSCLAIHADTVAVLEEVRDLVSEALDMLGDVLEHAPTPPITESDSEAEA